jgi:putative acetyltransferase
MSQGVRVELVTSPNDDVRALVAELEEALAAEYPPEQRHGLSLEAIFQPHIRFYVASLAGEAVACGGVALYPDFAEVKRMFVRPAARGRGIARGILDTLVLEARRAGHVRLLLETGPAQHEALRLYRRYGFSDCAAFGPYAQMPAHSIAASVFLAMDPSCGAKS